MTDEAERTALAWQRTGLSAATLLVLLAYDGVRLEQPALSVVSAAIAGVLLLFALRQFPTARVGGDPRRHIGRTITTLVGLVMATAVVGAIVGVAGFLR